MKLASLTIAMVLAGCAHVDPNMADQIALEHHFTRQDFMVDGFYIRTYRRTTDPAAPLRIYIEGDGRAWRSAHQPSTDPTPRKALGLMLATVDPAPNVAYVARPCQFNLASSPRCETAYWTDKRFAPEVIKAMQQAMDDVKGSQSSASIELVGYSGGAAVAALLAAQRPDVVSLRTIAGNLDSEAINRHHRVSAMPGSLNPIDSAPALSALPQWHFSGGLDPIIPAGIAESFVGRQSGHCAHMTLIAQATHEEGWIERWPELLTSIPACRQR